MTIGERIKKLRKQKNITVEKLAELLNKDRATIYRDVENGEIAAVLIENEATLKRVYKYDNRIELRPENPTYQVMNFENEELNHIKILGKAVGFYSLVR